MFGEVNELKLIRLGVELEGVYVTWYSRAAEHSQGAALNVLV